MKHPLNPASYSRYECYRCFSNGVRGIKAPHRFFPRQPDAWSLCDACMTIFTEHLAAKVPVPTVPPLPQ